VTHYEVLGLQPNSNAAQIRQAYRGLAKHLHPDRNPLPAAAEALKQVNAAYEVLKNPTRRRQYDLSLKVKPFIPESQPGSAVDLVVLFRQFCLAGRVPTSVVDALTPVAERKLDDVGISPKAATVEQILEALGWLKPKRRKRA
jgi:curved DNA-binding protein CbpA